MEDIQIKVETTPNPNALKFILNKDVIDEGKATFYSDGDCHGNPMARDLLSIKGVIQVHFFENVVSITRQDNRQASGIKWDVLSPQIKSVITTRLPVHNPRFNEQKAQQEKHRISQLSPQLQKIESILDKMIRIGLQADGGDIQVIKYEDNKLYVQYEGACGSCPSAITGTLYAIESILQEHFPDIQVIPIDTEGF